MNSITIAGTLGRDAELRHIPSGEPILSFSVADNAGGKEKPPIWWSCALWGKRGEALQQYLTKGQSVTVCGTVTEREWKDKDGAPRKSMDVRVQEIALQGGKRQEEAPRQDATRRPAARPQREEFDDPPF